MKVLSISFEDFFDRLEAAFVKTANIFFERYILLSRKQKDRESFEQFWAAISELTRTCQIELNAEQQDVFILNMGNCNPQWRLLSETLNPVDALN